MTPAELLKHHNLPTLAAVLTDVDAKSVNAAIPGLYSVAAQLNLPWLFITAEILKRRYPDNILGFLSRDCQLLHRLYRAHFDSKALYVPLSRIAVANDLGAAVDHLKSFKCDVLIDLSSTGATWQKIAERHNFNITVLIFSDQYAYTDKKPVPPAAFSWISKNSEIGSTNNVLELFNSADHGTLLGFNPLRYDHNELTAEQVSSIQGPVQAALDLRLTNQIPSELGSLTDQQLAELFKLFALGICTQTQILPLVPKFVEMGNESTVIARNKFSQTDEIS